MIRHWYDQDLGHGVYGYGNRRPRKDWKDSSLSFAIR